MTWNAWGLCILSVLFALLCLAVAAALGTLSVVLVIRGRRTRARLLAHQAELQEEIAAQAAVMTEQTEVIADREETIDSLTREVADAEDALAERELQLAEAQAAARRREWLMDQIEEAFDAQTGRAALYVTDGRDTILRGMGDPGLAVALEGPTAAPADDATHDEATGDEEKLFSVTSAGDGETRVHIVTDITAEARRVPALTEACEQLRARIEAADTYTNALNYAAWLRSYADRDAGEIGTLLFLRPAIAAGADTDHELAREAHMKACVELLNNTFLGRPVGRYPAYGFCCFIPGFGTEEVRRMIKALPAALDHLYVASPYARSAARGTVIELAPHTGGDPDRVVLCMAVRAAEDMRAGRTGVRLFDPADVGKLLFRRAEIERLIAGGSLRFTYRPIARTADGRLHAYEMIPDLSELTCASTEELLYHAESFGMGNELADFFFSAGMRGYERALADGKLLYTTRVWLDLLPGGRMTARDEQTFHEKHYDALKNLIAEPTESADDKNGILGKAERIKCFGAVCAISLGRDPEDDMRRLLVADPTIVRIPCTLLANEAYRPLLRELTARHTQGGLELLVDGVTSAETLKIAMNADAEYVMGDYVGRADGEPGKITDICMNRIAQIRFGKRG